MLSFRTTLILAAVAAPFMMAQTAPSGCQNATQALATVHTDLANIETAAGNSITAACAFAPILQADVSAVVAISKLNATQIKDVNSAQAAISAACTNPSAQNSAAIIARVGAAIAQIEAIQAGAQ